MTQIMAWVQATPDISCGDNFYKLIIICRVEGWSLRFEGFEFGLLVVRKIIYETS